MTEPLSRAASAASLWVAKSQMANNQRQLSGLVFQNVKVSIRVDAHRLTNTDLDTEWRLPADGDAARTQILDIDSPRHAF